MHLVYVELLNILLLKYSKNWDMERLLIGGPVDASYLKCLLDYHPIISKIDKNFSRISKLCQWNTRTVSHLNWKTYLKDYSRKILLRESDLVLLERPKSRLIPGSKELIGMLFSTKKLSHPSSPKSRVKLIPPVLMKNLSFNQSNQFRRTHLREKLILISLTEDNL